MTNTTPNTRLDAVLRVVEDTALAAAAALGTWESTHSIDATLGAVIGVPVVRSGVAAALSSGRVSGVVLALKLVRQALGYLDTASSGLSLGTVTVTPVVAPAAPAPVAASVDPTPLAAPVADPAPAPAPVAAVVAPADPVPPATS